MRRLEVGADQRPVASAGVHHPGQRSKRRHTLALVGCVVVGVGVVIIVVRRKRTGLDAYVVAN